MTDEELRAILVMVSQLTKRPMPDTLPSYKEVTHEWIAKRTCPTTAQRCRFFSMYDPALDTIFISTEGLNWKAVDNLVAHEMSHYLDDLDGLFVTPLSCETLADMERRAYHAQRLYVWMVQGDFGGLPTPPYRCNPAKSGP